MKLSKDDWQELRRLHDAGFALHWLRPNSKAPLAKKGWQKGPRLSWEELKRAYRSGYNVGVRLGHASLLSDRGKSFLGFLAVIDCDVKSDDPKHLKEMRKRLASLLSITTNPSSLVCLSGRGRGSKHVYLRSEKPVAPRRLAQSSEMVRVHMPSVKPSKADWGALNGEKVEAGYRIRPAWEISLMSEGQQVVLPPSIHPDSHRAYKWNSDLTWGFQIPRLSNSVAQIATGSMSSADAGQKAPFKLADVDLQFDPRLIGQQGLVDLIHNGEGCSDRSASLYRVSKQLSRLGFTEDEILTLLSDRDSYLGQTAYDHTQSSSRSRAVHWLRRYTVDKGTAQVREERSTVLALLERINPDEAREEAKALSIPFAHEDFDWQTKIERTGKDQAGPPRSSLKNVVLILSHAVGRNLFRRDLFRNRDSYGIETPWGGRVGVAIRDTDVNLIRHWLAKHWRFEPPQNFVIDAIDVMAEWNGFHPIRDYLNALPEWDGIDRLGGWLRRNLGAVGPGYYLSEVFTKWMVAAVKRIFEPGAQFDWMMVLEGNEGIGKSTFFRDLAGADFFRDGLPDLRDKDAAQALDGMWIVELAEVENYFNRHERQVFKAYLTRRIDKYRPPYGKKMIEAHRQCVFTGSTNEERYLYDDAENRRVTPVKLEPGAKINWGANKKWRNQLWAEALAIYRLGLCPVLELEGEAKLYASRLRRQEKQILTDADLMADILKEWRRNITVEAEERWNFGRLSIRDLFDVEKGGPLDKWKMEIKNMMLAARAMKLLGATKRGIAGSNFWAWKVVDTSQNKVSTEVSKVSTPKREPW